MGQTQRKLTIAIPASLVSDVPHLREKTLKIGLVGRAVAVFCVDEVVIFPDFPQVDQRKSAKLIATLLSYMETPQYLRKLLFKLEPGLRYAGILPPLRTPHHPLSNRIGKMRVGENREGVVLHRTPAGSFVEIGVERPVLIPQAQLSLNSRVTVRIAKLGKRPRALLVDRRSTPGYWGYSVRISNVPLGKKIKEKPFELVIATSRQGTAFYEISGELSRLWKKSGNTLVAFGAPSQGLHKIIGFEGLRLDEVSNFIVNTIPNQGTKTVRTEEALFATLAILNSYSCFGE